MTSTQTTAEQDVRDLLHAVYEAWAANDADAFADLYVEDATVAMPRSLKLGKAEIRDYMAAAFAGPLKGSSARDTPQRIRFLSDNDVVVLSSGGVLMPGESEVPEGRTVTATWVLTKSAGSWRVAAYHNCPAQSQIR